MSVSAWIIRLFVADMDLDKAGNCFIINTLANARRKEVV